tara:strand:- start:570 stop:1154 length:585 start_codon:yes stop_codon:yes gene_type:complete
MSDDDSQHDDSQQSFCSDSDNDMVMDYDETAFDDTDMPMVTREDSDAVLDGGALLSEQEAQISSIVDLLQVSRTNAAALLAKFEWNNEKLLERWMDNPSKALESAGLSVPACGASTSSSGSLCNVCFSDYEPHEMSASRCGHSFCNDCWQGYLDSQISDGVASGIVCMAEKCTAPLDVTFVQALIPSATFSKVG